MVLAEITDKMPSIVELLIWNMFLVIVMISFCQSKRCFIPLLFLFAFWWIYGFLNDFLLNDFFYQTVVREMGKGYVVTAIVLAHLPLLAIILNLLLSTQKAQKMDEKNCR